MNYSYAQTLCYLEYFKKIVARLYSAHTQDALKVPYTGKSSFGTSCNSLEYWVFTNSDTN